MEKLKYPIGKLDYDSSVENTTIKKWIQTIKNFPDKVTNEVIDLSKEELNYKYRPNGWTIKQVVAHCLDSHTNSVIRFKLTLTEQNPTIKPYDEAQWAKLTDTLDYDIKDLLQALQHLHKRWVFLLESLTEEQLNRTFIHPENNEIINLKENIYIYTWHCKHHLQHIINAKQYKY